MINVPAIVLTTKKYRILILAEAANPEWTSVPLLGWLHTAALAEQCDVHLVTHVRNQQSIERAGWELGKNFTVIDNEYIAAPIYKLSGLLRGGRSLAWTIDTALSSLVYPFFERIAWKLFKDDLQQGKYDLVHRITPVSPTASSFFAKRLSKIGVPFVIGPLNGGVRWPKEFVDLSRKEREWLNKFRNAYKLLPGYRSTRKYATAIICGSKATMEQMSVDDRSKLHYLPENAIDTERFNQTNTSDYTLPIKAAFIGRLVPYKGTDMAIEAMAPLLSSGKMEYDIFGDGPELTSLKSLTKGLGVDKEVRFHGFVDNKIIQRELVKCDLLVFPSIREFGGAVVLEAMAVGVVPVVADYAGPAELIDENCGYKVAMGTRDQLIDNFRHTLEKIVANPKQLVKKRDAARSQVEQRFTWKRKIQAEIEIYKKVLKRKRN